MEVYHIAIIMMGIGALIAYANFKDSEGSKKWGLIGILIAALGLYLLKDDLDRNKHAEQVRKDLEYRRKTEKACEYCGGFGCYACKGEGWEKTHNYIEEHGYE